MFVYYIINLKRVKSVCKINKMSFKESTQNQLFGEGVLAKTNFKAFYINNTRNSTSIALINSQVLAFDDFLTY